MTMTYVHKGMIPVPEAVPIPPVSPHAFACDKCGAKAKIRYVLLNNQDLLFCGHHNRAFQDSVTALGHRRIDVFED